MILDGLAIRLRCRVHRAHDPRWAIPPNSGQGAAWYGGRFNPKGMPALYTAMSVTTAWYEAQQGFLLKPQPYTLCAYEVDCTDIVDLTSTRTLDALGLDEPALRDAAWRRDRATGKLPYTHEVAEKLLEIGAAGAIYASVAPGVPPGAKNVVFWRWNDRPPHQVRVIDDRGRLT